MATLTDAVRLLSAVAVDTSCLVAVVLRETDHEIYEICLTQASTLHLSAVSRVELGLVAASKNVSPRAAQLLEELSVKIVPFDEAQATLANAAFIQYGKGRHRAALNFGDCCAYALAKSLTLPLLYKGHDFAQTDITSALA